MSTTPDEPQPQPDLPQPAHPDQSQPTPPDVSATQPTTPLPDAVTREPETPQAPQAPQSPEPPAAAAWNPTPPQPAQEAPAQAAAPQAAALQPEVAAPQVADPVHGPQAAAASFTGAPGYAGAPAGQAPAMHHAPVAAQDRPQRHGGLIAGIAIGALIGGLVGGGAAAVVAHNANTGSTVQSSASGSAITINDPDQATTVTAVAALATPSVVTIQASDGSTSGSGSGVVYSEDGYIITNAHVATLEGATGNPQLQVQMSDGKLYPGKLVGSDPYADIAVIKIEATGLTPIGIADSNELNVGDIAIAIGAPLSLSNTVTSGVVSALNRGISVASSMVPEQQSGGQDPNTEDQNQQGSPFPWFEFQNPNGQQQGQSSSATVAIPVIQTDASINPGNSGGALLDAQGKLIGINVALASAAGTSAGAGSDGLGFAVPVTLATRVADSLIDGEQPSHGLLGVLQTTQSSGANVAGGVVGDVTSGGPADKAGLRAGDVITSINGARADSYTTVTALVRMYPAGTEVTVGYNRDGENYETTVTLAEMEW